MRWCAMPRPRWRPSMSNKLDGSLTEAAELLGLVAAKTSKPARMGCFASPDGWPAIG